MSKHSTPKIHLVRSDMGDGGWSLHAHRLDYDMERPEDEWPLLISGDGRRGKGGWAQPSQRAYATARRIARGLPYQIEVA